MDPLATANELVTAAQRPSLTPDQAQLALRRVSGAIRAWCGWPISLEVVTSQIIRPGRPWRSWLFLPTLHLVSVEGVTEGGVALVDGTDFEWNERGRLLRNGWWSDVLDSIVVSYTHGFADGEAERELARDVCLAAAVRRVQNPQSHSSETTGTESWLAGVETVGRVLTDAERQELGPIRRLT